MVSNLKVMADRYSDPSDQHQAVVTMHEVIASHQQEANANPGEDHFEEEGIDDEERQDDGDTDQEEDEDEEEDYGNEEQEEEDGEFSGESFTEGDEGDTVNSEDPQWQKNQNV